jgi:hypothetical protein
MHHTNWVISITQWTWCGPGLRKGKEMFRTCSRTRQSICRVHSWLNVWQWLWSGARLLKCKRILYSFCRKMPLWITTRLPRHSLQAWKGHWVGLQYSKTLFHACSWARRHWSSSGTRVTWLQRTWLYRKVTASFASVCTERRTWVWSHS